MSHEVDTDVLSQLPLGPLDPWPAIVTVSCNCAHPVPAKVLDDVSHGRGLVFIIGDGAREGLELILVAEESAEEA